MFGLRRGERDPHPARSAVQQALGAVLVPVSDPQSGELVAWMDEQALAILERDPAQDTSAFTAREFIRPSDDARQPGLFELLEAARLVDAVEAGVPALARAHPGLRGQLAGARHQVAVAAASLAEHLQPPRDPERAAFVARVVVEDVAAAVRAARSALARVAGAVEQLEAAAARGVAVEAGHVLPEQLRAVVLARPRPQAHSRGQEQQVRARTMAVGG